MQLYRYFVSQSSEFCRHNPLCGFRYRLSPRTFAYTHVYYFHYKLLLRVAPASATY